MIVVIDDSAPAARQLYAALRAYAARVQRDGGVLAPDVLVLLRALEAASATTTAANRGQARTELATSSTPADDSGMELVSYRSAAAVLGVSARTVRRRVADGTLPGVRVGPGSVRVPVAALTQLTRGHGHTSTSGVPDEQ